MRSREARFRSTKDRSIVMPSSPRARERSQFRSIVRASASPDSGELDPIHYGEAAPGPRGLAEVRSPPAEGRVGSTRGSPRAQRGHSDGVHKSNGGDTSVSNGRLFFSARVAAEGP